MDSTLNEVQISLNADKVKGSTITKIADVMYGRFLVRRLWDHHEFKRVGRGWSCGDPTVTTIAVRKERSVCTVTAVATDDAAIACALGSSGKVELWDRRLSQRVPDAVLNEFCYGRQF